MHPDSDDPLANAIWQALTTSQEHLGLAHGQARRYRPDIAPFAAAERQTAQAMRDLHTLLQPAESVYLVGSEPVEISGLQQTAPVAVLQMILPASAELPAVRSGIDVVDLSCSEAAEMSALIDIAYPGFFRAQTCRMGRYYGVRDAGGELIAMGGERILLGQYREVSGLCTHPSHVGRGLGTAILRRILAHQRALGATPWLYVLESNRVAVQLYGRLGFEVLRGVDLHRITRVGDAR